VRSFNRIPCHLATAHDDALDLVGRGCERIAENFFETAVREVFDLRAALFHSQRLLGREDDERLAQIATHLTTKDVEVLRGSRAI